MNEQVIESGLQSHVTLIDFVIAVYCFQVYNRPFSSFSKWCMLMHEYRAVFQQLLGSHLWCCLNCKQRFNIIQVHGFLSKFFSFVLCSIPSRFSWLKMFSKPLFFQLLPIFTHKKNKKSLFWPLHMWKNRLMLERKYKLQA